MKTRFTRQDLIALVIAAFILGAVVGHAIAANPTSSSTTRTCRPHGASSIDQAGRVTVTGCVERAVDGDTLVIGAVKVRLLGVDTPETHDPRKPVQCYGPEAAAFTADYAAGREATVSSEPSSGDVYDRYGRMLGYVHVHRHDLGAVLLERGYAKVYAFDNRRFGKRVRYQQLQDVASTEGIGRWGRC